MLCCSGTQVSGVPLPTQVTHHFLVFIYLPKNVPGSFVSRIRRCPLQANLYKKHTATSKTEISDLRRHTQCQQSSHHIPRILWPSQEMVSTNRADIKIHLMMRRWRCCTCSPICRTCAVFTTRFHGLLHKWFGGKLSKTYQNLWKPMNLKDLPRFSLSRSHDQVGSFQHSTWAIRWLMPQPRPRSWTSR